MVKSLVSKLSSASSTLSIASSFGSSHGKHDSNAASTASTAISGDNYLKYRNDPGRFFGDGVQFKAKLIGILEVGEARGDRMCQEALQDLKMAIRAAGEHKQRITIHVTIDGLRLRDEKTGDSLYHHPVHKISFIAQDMTDSRAFGYIFGSPDSGHRFFGIKTDKAASQVVLAMRDLFQVVFELKKKEIELARQQIQSKSLHHHDQHQLSSLSSLKSAAAGTAGQNDLSGLGGSTTSAATLSMLNTMVSSSTNTPNASRLGVNLDSKGASKEISPESVADLVDLEQELSSLQRGITQMERITPNDAHSHQNNSLSSTTNKTSLTAVTAGGNSDDPFGDSFTNFPTLPPPEPGRLRSKNATPKNNDLANIPITSAGNNSLLSPTATQSGLTTVSTGLTTTTTSNTVTLQPLDDDDDNWLRELDAHSDVFDTSKTIVPGLMGMPPLASSIASSVPLATRAPLAARESSDTPPNHIYETVSCSANAITTDIVELTTIAGATANNNAESTNLTNSSSLTDIFQTAASEANHNSKPDIKSDAFTDLDPLGTGRTRPYVDKKYFFQELKNPPKKVLKDLTTCTTATINTTTNAITTTTLTTANIVMANLTATTTTTATNLMGNIREDILSLGDLELKTVKYQQQQLQQQQQIQQQQQQHMQQQQLKMSHSTLNTLLTTTSTANVAIIPSAILSSSSSSCTTTTTTTTTTTNILITANAINYATTGTTTTTTPTNTNTTNATNATTITTANSYHNNNNNKSSNAISCTTTTTTTATTARNFICSTYKTGIATTSITTSTALNNSQATASAIAIATINSKNMIQVTATTTSNATATNTSTIATTNANNFNVNTNVVNVQSNVKNSITASAFSTTVSASSSTCATALTSNSLICTCPTSIIVTCTTTNVSSTNNLRYTTTTNTNNNNSNNTNTNSNSNNNNNNCINNRSSATSISRNSNNKSILSHYINKKNTNSSSLLPTTTVANQYQTSLALSLPSSSSSTLLSQSPLPMKLNSNLIKSSNGGSCYTAAAAGGSGGGGCGFAVGEVGGVAGQIQSSASASLSSTSSLTTTTPKLRTITTATITTTTTSNSTTTTTNTTSTSTTQSTIMTQTNALRFSRYYPPLEPVAVAVAADPVMLPRDTDPFSPTRKKSDPFEEGGDIFSKLDPFEFEFTSSGTTADAKDKTRKSSSPSAEQQQTAVGGIQSNQDILSGHLQVNLPPESDLTQTTSTIRSRPVPSAMVGANNSGPQSTMGGSLPPAAILKQQTVDVISSISNKKMPHLFGQSSRFSKRDSNSINMRRLQESDSLSETETAPEPPPRPDSASYAEPPPLPPKKQFNDIIIRPRQGPSPTLSSSAGNRYYGLTSSILTSSASTTKGMSARSNCSDVPPIPLPSRRVGRTDGSYPGPGRPRKPGHTEDDYLAPITLFNTTTTSAAISNSSNITDVPPLLPPPTQISSRARNQRQQSLTQQNKVHDIYENKSEILQQLQQQQQQQQQQQLQKQENAPAPNIVPDITLTQLLTLGIDELALKLNVPTTKLSTMTLVELTSYLSEFLEQSKPKHEHKILPPPDDLQQQQQQHQQPTTPIFKVNFDQEATFVAKFDDTFGEDFHQQLDIGGGSSMTFEANFAQFDNMNVEPPGQAAQQNTSGVPPADRYAVFREIIDQELQQQQESVDLIGDIMETENLPVNDDKQFESSPITDLNINISHQQDLLSGDMLEVSGPQPPKIDTKISEVLAQAKDRYAALRDLILVENLFDKPPPKPPSITTDMDGTQSESKSPFQGFTGFNDDEEDQDLRQLMDQTSTLDVNTQQQRLGLVDSRGFLVEPSSSAITVEEDEDEEEEDRRNTREDIGGISSADSNEKEQDKDALPTSKYEQLASSNQQLEEIEEKPEKFDETTPQISITQSQMASGNDSKYLSVASVASSGLSGSKDDLEIDDLMQRAISNLSLDSRERNSPATQAQQQQNTHTVTTTMTPPHFNDVSTSPIPLQRSPGPSLTSQQNKSPSNKSSQQVSPLPSQLTVVSQIIDAATKQIQNETVTKTANDSWATFDTPQHQPQVVASDKRARPSAKMVAKGNNFLNLPPPPGSISNCSQNDSAIESPCSSDPREEAWHRHTMGGSSLSLGHQTAGHVSSLAAQRRYHKKERQNTSSSSRDLSWDEDQGSIPPPPPPHVMDYPPSKRLPGQSQGSLTTDRHGYYRRHARRMNSCDDDYEYDQDYATSRRDQCKYKHSLSRSRDNFEMDSPGWYHHHAPQHAHNTWSSQDIEQARGRAFERSAYERTTYGPPIYDKRSVGPPLPPPTSSYDRRSAGSAVGGYDKRGKYYRGDLNSRPSNTERIYNLDDFDEMLAASGKIPPHLASMYEEMKTECCSPPLTSHRSQRTADYMYERDRKSFDRESLESYEGSNVAPRRRRRSYDSGGIPSDPYGSCDSRDEYHGRERCVMSGEKSRSLRKSMKSLRVMGDIDYDQDSEKEYHYRDQRARCDSRNLQRPSQLSTQGGIGSSGGLTGANIMGSQGRIRKSSGSSPWDGEEPPLPGQKSSTSSWKRPSSAAESERRRAVAKGQTPSGSDEDKDRRYRKKRTTRNKDLSAISSNANRYGRGANYDYISCEDLDDDAEDYVDEEEEEEVHGIEHDEISPADEDKFARLEMRRHEMHNRMMDAHVRRRKEVPPSQTQVVTSMAYRKGVNKGGYIRRPLPPPTEHKHPQDYGFDDDGDDGEYEQTPTPRSNTSSALPTATPNTSTKFSFDVGFESDFNQSSPPPAPAGTASSCNSTPAANASTANTPASKSSFRFSNDFSAGQEREKHIQHPAAGSLQQYDMDNRGLPPQTSTQTSTPKLRFDDNVKVSQFDDAFEDDFSKATFDAFPNDDVQWQESLAKTAKQQIRNNKLQQRQQELIKKSESVNIFAKKVEDPFEDDEFFNSPPVPTTSNNSNDKTENHKTTASNGNGNGGTGGGGGGGVCSSNNGKGNNGNGTVESSAWDDDNTNFAKFDENM